MGILDWFKVDDETAKKLDDAQVIENNKSRDQLINEQLKRAEVEGAKHRADLATIPAAIPRLITAPIEAVQGIDQIVSAFGQRSGDVVENLQRGRYRQGGFDKVQKFLADKQAEFQAANPDATPKQIKEFVSKYQNTPEFVEFDRSQIPSVYAFNEKVGDAIDNAMGAPPDNLKTNTQTVLNAVTQAVVPVNIASKLPTAARIASEFLLPGNQAKTNAGKLAVAGTAGALTAGINALTGRDVKPEEFIEAQEAKAIPSTKYAELNTDDGMEDAINADTRIKTSEATSSVVPAGASLAAFGMLGAALLGQKVKVNASLEKDVGKSIHNIPNKAGVVAEDAPTAINKSVDAISNATNTVFDERAPVVRAISRANRDNDPSISNKLSSYETAVRQSNEAGIYSSSAAGSDKNVFYSLGRIGGQQITPMKTVDDIWNVLVRNGEANDVDLYLKARTVLSDHEHAIADVNKRLQDQYIKMSAEQSMPKDKQNIPKQHEILDAIDKLHKELETTISGNNAYLQQYTPKQLKEIVDAAEAGGNGALSDLGKKYVQLIDENQKTMLDYPVKMGVLEPIEVDKIGAKHSGTHVPLMEDRHKGRTGVARLFSNAARSVDNLNDPISTYANSINPFSKRLNDPNHVPDFLMSTNEAVLRRNDQLINWVNHELYKQDIVGKIMRGKNADEVLELFKDTHGRTAFPQRQADMFESDAVDKLKDYIPVRLEGNGGKVSFVKFKDEHKQLDNMFRLGPAAQSVMGGIANMTKRGATGVFQLGFAPMSTMLENAGFQALRPRGSVGYVDNAFYRTSKALGYEPSQRAMDAVRFASTPIDILVGQADAILKAGEQWYKINRINLAHELLDKMETGNGWFGQMMNIPEFRSWAANWSKGVVDTFQDTQMAALVDGKGMTFNTLMQNMEHTNSLFREFDIKFPNALKMAAQATGIPTIINQYKIFITAYRDATKYAYFGRNEAFYKLKHGVDELPEKEIKRLMNETRTITGDFTKRMGNRTLQSVDDAIPYLRVTVQATKNAYQRMVNDPRLAASIITGFIVPKVMMEYDLANWDKEAYDWYYRGTTAVDRSAFIGLVRPDIWVRRHILGENIPFKPEYIHKLYSPQEFRAIIEGTAAAIRGTGAYNAGQKDRIGGGSFGEQIGEALKASFGISTPPLLGAGLAQAGIKMELGNAFTGENIFQTPRSQDAPNKLLTSDTNVTQGQHDVLGALFGTIGKSLAQGFASGQQIYNKTDNLADAVFGGLKEAGGRVGQFRQSPIPFVDKPLPWISSVNERRYRTTPVSQEMYRNREAFSVIMGSRNGKAFTPEDSVLAPITQELRIAASTADPKQFSREYKELDQKIKDIDRNRTVPLSQRQELNKNNLKELHALTIEQQKWMLAQQDRIGRQTLENGMTISQAYKAKFGTDFTLKDFAQKVKALKTKAMQ